MTTDRCDRAWQVEALADGRLEPKDGASFERHVESCASCAAERARLQELQATMAQAPSGERTDLERRRARIALLGDANRRLLARRPGSRTLSVSLLAATLAVALLCVVAFGRHRAPPVLPAFEVVDLAGADWSSEKSAGVARVTLRAGVASFHVEHVAPGARFLLRLPDGELEVRGTRFVVEVAHGQTRSVVVSDGVVALRLAGSEQLIRAGGQWQRAPASPAFPLPPAMDAPSTPSVEIASAPAAASSLRPLANAAAAAGTANAAPRAVADVLSAPLVSASSLANAPAPSAAVPQLGASAGARFAQAIEAFRAGDYGRADGLLAAFARDFPRDSRAEDATFLCADARARRGDRRGAAAAARAYLFTFPHGLRRPEAERLTAEQ